MRTPSFDLLMHRLLPHSTDSPSPQHMPMDTDLPQIRDALEAECLSKYLSQNQLVSQRSLIVRSSAIMHVMEGAFM